MSEWRWIPLGEHAENHDGRRVPVSEKKRQLRRGQFPYYGASGVIDTIDSYTHEGEYLLIGEDGANLLSRSKPIAFIAHGKIWVNNHAHVLRCRPGHSNKFLGYYINSIDLAPYVTGTAQPKLNQAMMNKIPVPVPPGMVQERIVADLDKQFSRLDEAVANLKRVAARLGRYRRCVLAEAFNLEPTTTLAALINLGPQNGLYLPKSEYGSGTPILRIDDYQFDWSRPVGELRQVRAREEQARAWRLEAGDLVVNRVNSVSHLGKAMVVPDAMEGALFESNMMRMQLADNVLPRFVELYLGSPVGRQRLTANAKWAVNQASINQQDVRGTTLPLPALAEQRRIVADVDRRLSIVREVEAEVDANLKRASSLRAAVLGRAFSVDPLEDNSKA